MTLNYNNYTYTPTRDELKKFFKHELSKEEKLKYKFHGDGLTKVIPQMKPGDIYYNPVLKKYMVMEETGNMNYLTTDDFVDRFGGINA